MMNVSGIWDEIECIMHVTSHAQRIELPPKPINPYTDYTQRHRLNMRAKVTFSTRCTVGIAVDNPSLMYVDGQHGATHDEDNGESTSGEWQVDQKGTAKRQRDSG